MQTISFGLDNPNQSSTRLIVDVMDPEPTTSIARFHYYASGPALHVNPLTETPVDQQTDLIPTP
jgi:hypothetical protein